MSPVESAIYTIFGFGRYKFYEHDTCYVIELTDAASLNILLRLQAALGGLLMDVGASVQQFVGEKQELRLRITVYK